MKHIHRTLACFLIMLVLLASLSSVALLTIAATDDNIQSDAPVELKAFDSTIKHSARAFTEGVPVGMRLGLGAPFNRITVAMPTWSDTGVSLTLSLYKWNTDFDTTRAVSPLASRRVENHRDNAQEALEFNEMPAGEYLLCIDEFTGGRLGVWQLPANVGQGYAYESGNEQAFDWEIRVSFTKTPVTAFLPLESAAAVIDGNHVSPPEAEISVDALVNTHKVMPDTWVFTDGLGRTSLTYEDVGAPRENKEIAMFYWTWHAEASKAAKTPFNINDFILKYPEAKNDYDHPEWPNGSIAYFWNEPIYGYYRGNDPWVLRRQAELLANAGVDTIFTDNTNGSYTWKSGYTALFEAWESAQNEGAVSVPKVSFMLPFGATAGTVEQIENLYLDIYRPGKYQNLWYYFDGKPMLMAYNNAFVEGSASSNIKKEIENFFTWRSGQAVYRVDHTSVGQWGWLSVYPQAIYYGTRENTLARQVEQMTVGVAVNHDYVTKSITAMNGEHVMGRSYTSSYEDRYLKEGSEATKWGYFFSEQFEYAIEKDPKVIFITGWNEWTAGPQESWYGVENAFADQFNDEFSRDLEPSKGALKDYYYYLFVNYVRKYKGCNPIPTPSAAQTINLSGNADQWNTAEPYYAAYIGNTEDRNAKGYGSLTYTETSGRNDIIGARIARDDETVWFYVECNENITPYTDKLWMNLLIDTDQTNQGWETFEYVVNKSAASADTLILEKFTGDGYASEKVADVRYKVDGKTMVVEIPKSVLNLSGYDYTINFAWTDNVHDEGDYETFSGDIMDFYISGDVAPGARFKFSYISTADNAGKEIEMGTDTESKTETEAEIESDTEKSDEGGCASAVSVGGLMLVGVMMAGAILLRRKERTVYKRSKSCV